MSTNPIDTLNWQAPDNWFDIETIELHTGGEPLRVFTKGLPKIKGNTIKQYIHTAEGFKNANISERTMIIYAPQPYSNQGAMQICTQPLLLNP